MQSTALNRLNSCFLPIHTQLLEIREVGEAGQELDWLSGPGPNPELSTSLVLHQATGHGQWWSDREPCPTGKRLPTAGPELPNTNWILLPTLLYKVSCGSYLNNKALAALGLSCCLLAPVS